MSNFYVKFIKQITLPKYELLSSIAYTGNVILTTATTGDKIYTISNSGVILNEQTLDNRIVDITYDFVNQNILGYNDNDNTIITIYDNNFNNISTINLNFNTSKFIPLQNITYNLQSDTINLTYLKDINTITTQGDISNNIHIDKSKYYTSNISGAYIFSSILNNSNNFLVKTNLANDLIDYYKTPKNIKIVDLSIISADIYKTRYYALGYLNNTNYLLELCFSQPLPTNNNIYNQNNQSLFNLPANPYNPYNINQYGYNFNPSQQNDLSQNIYGSNNPYFQNNAVGGFSIMSPFLSGLSGKNCNMASAFSLFIYSSLYNQNDSNTSFDDFEIMIPIIILICFYKNKNKSNQCYPNICDKAFFDNADSLNISTNFNNTYRFNNNPLI
ncbi:MAG: hypothetical protein ACRCZK_05280 [Oscillospiraceae bacterium]